MSDNIILKQVSKYVLFKNNTERISFSLVTEREAPPYIRKAQGRMAYRCSVVFLILVRWLLCATSPTALTAEINARANGTELIDFSKSINNTLLTLIGNAFVNLENKVQNLEKRMCQISMNTCSQWTTWSSCSATRSNSFGLQTRTRTCGLNSSKDCANNGNVTTDNDSKLCERWCGQEFTITRHNFCVKINTTLTTQPDAEKQCAQEGGHLMNMDTEDRWTDFVEFSRSMYTGNLWIDGTRAVQHGNWRFLSGLDPAKNGVNHWYSGEPSNGGDELCKISGLINNTRYWLDRSCNEKTAFVCEAR